MFYIEYVLQRPPYQVTNDENSQKPLSLQLVHPQADKLGHEYSILFKLPAILWPSLSLPSLTVAQHFSQVKQLPMTKSGFQSHLPDKTVYPLLI